MNDNAARQLNQLLMEIINDGARDDGSSEHFDALAPHFANASAGKKQIPIVSMPKSGSSFFAILLHEVTGFPYVSLRYASGGREGEFYFPRLLNYMPEDYITKCHVRATNSEVHLLNAFNLKPVIQVRNIFDTIISYYDHVHKDHVMESVGRQKATMTYLTPITKEYYECSFEEKIDLMIDTAAPWYLKFYVSWIVAQRENLLDMMWMSYEKLTTDTTSALGDVFAFYDVDVPEARIAEGIERANAARNEGTGGYNRIAFNKGVTGRGRAMMTDSQIERIVTMARRYKSFDFTMIGIP